jgi:hypothetical protein
MQSLHSSAAHTTACGTASAAASFDRLPPILRAQTCTRCKQWWDIIIKERSFCHCGRSAETRHGRPTGKGLHACGAAFPVVGGPIMIMQQPVAANGAVSLRGSDCPCFWCKHAQVVAWPLRRPTPALYQSQRPRSRARRTIVPQASVASPRTAAAKTAVIVGGGSEWRRQACRPRLRQDAPVAALTTPHVLLPHAVGGLVVAGRLAQAGLKVTLLEQGAEVRAAAPPAHHSTATPLRM